MARAGFNLVERPDLASYVYAAGLYYAGVAVERSPIPSGNEFLEIIEDHANKVSRHTSARLPQLGSRAPAAHRALGTALGYLDCAATCFWRCRGGDHKAEYLLGRAVSSAYAALRLMKSGYYDESLSLVRTIAEIVNLMALFTQRPTTLENWKSLDERARRREFSPVRVRILLSETDNVLPIAEDRYSALSDFGIHANPSSAPQLHNAARKPTTVARYQEAGLLMATNELAIAVGFLCVFAPRLLDLHPEQAALLRDGAQSLSGSIGGILATERERLWFNAPDPES